MVKFRSFGRNGLVAALILAAPPVLQAQLTGYLKIPDIPGESQRVDHEGEIDIHDIQWKVERPSSLEVGSGRTSARAVVSPLRAKKYYDASSPYLALASMQGRVLPTLTLTVRKDSGEAHLDYLTITMTNVQVVSYEVISSDVGGLISEQVGFLPETINIKYIVQEEDHSAGDEHEITYDIAAGA